MKRLALLSALIIPLLVVAGFIVTDKTKSKEPLITFYKTPLVCAAAPDIGCGSRSKPVLLELEKNPAVKEAWLNRPGTVIAIVWEDKVQTEIVAKTIFNKHNIELTELTEEKAAPYRKNFRKENLWYRGADVDLLSREEATVIAKSFVKLILENNLVTKEEAAKIKMDIDSYFKEELVKIFTREQLNEGLMDLLDKYKEGVYKIVEKHIGRDRAGKATDFFLKSLEN